MAIEGKGVMTRRIEDTISVADLMKKDVKELLIMVYFQQVQTNGNVRRLDAENKDIRDVLQQREVNCKAKEKDYSDRLQSKISVRGMTTISVILGVIIVGLQILKIFGIDF